MVIYAVIDWTQIQGFDWDECNNRKSLEKHGVGQSEAEEVFFNEPLLVVPDAAHSLSETRVHALGKTDVDRLLHVTFTVRDGGRLVRVISVRTMHRKERIRYEQET